MKVDVPPAVFLAFPYACLVATRRLRIPVAIDGLNETHVADDGDILAQQSDVRRSDRRLLRFVAAAEIEVEAMKVHAFDQLASSFGLERADRRIAKSLIRLPIRRQDAVEQLLAQVQ